MDPAPAPRLLQGLAAALPARRGRIESILARSESLSSPAVLHDLRVALRRTAAVARLTRGFPARGDGEALRTAARDLRRALSVTRTREVTVRRLRERFRRDAAKAKTARKLADQLESECRESFHPQPAEARLRELRRAFSFRDAGLERLNRPLFRGADSKGEKTLRKMVWRRLKKKRRRLLEAALPTAETVHPLRIAAKDLRYSLELVSGIVPGAKDLLDRLQEFQDAAGSAHDRAELISEVRRIAGACPPPLRRDAMRLLPVLMRDAEQSLARSQTSFRKLQKDLKKKEIDLA